MKTLALAAALSLFACSSAERIGFDPSASPDAGPVVPSPVADAGPSATDGGDAAAPVTPDAGPLPGGPTSYKAPCTTPVSNYWYADVDVPGKTATELARVIAYVPTVSPIPGLAAKYPLTAGTVMIRDGGVAVFCGSSSSTMEATFIVP